MKLIDIELLLEAMQVGYNSFLKAGRYDEAHGYFQAMTDVRALIPHCERSNDKTVEALRLQTDIQRLEFELKVRKAALRELTE